LSSPTRSKSLLGDGAVDLVLPGKPLERREEHAPDLAVDQGLAHLLGQFGRGGLEGLGRHGPAPHDAVVADARQPGQLAADDVEDLRDAHARHQQADQPRTAGSRGRHAPDIRARPRAALDEPRRLQIAQRPGHGGARNPVAAHKLRLARHAPLLRVFARRDLRAQSLENLPVLGDVCHEADITARHAVMTT
jgi:hypothetical protein